MRTIDVLRHTGRALAEFSNADRNEAWHFAVKLTDEMYPKSRRHRDWAHDNIMLFYDNARRETEILNEHFGKSL